MTQVASDILSVSFSDSGRLWFETFSGQPIYHSMNLQPISSQPILDMDEKIEELFRLHDKGISFQECKLKLISSFSRLSYLELIYTAAERDTLVVRVYEITSNKLTIECKYDRIKYFPVDPAVWGVSFAICNYNLTRHYSDITCERITDFPTLIKDILTGNMEPTLPTICTYNIYFSQTVWPEETSQDKPILKRSSYHTLAIEIEPSGWVFHNESYYKWICRRDFATFISESCSSSQSTLEDPENILKYNAWKIGSYM